MSSMRPISDFRNHFSDIESILDKSDFQAKNTDVYLSHDEVFGKIRENIKNADV